MPRFPMELIFFFFFQATQEEISNAYRRMSRLYHPDKHASRPGMTEKAELLFNKIKKAHDGELLWAIVYVAMSNEEDCINCWMLKLIDPFISSVSTEASCMDSSIIFSLDF